MKAATPLVIVSLCANLALGGWSLLRPSREVSASHPSNAPLLVPPAAHRAADANAASSETANTLADATSLRDRLRALGFSAEMIRAAVRAHLEAPRLARERDLRAAAGAKPWWQAGFQAYLYHPSFTAEQNRELRALRQTERAEIERVLGPAGNATAADLERYFYLPGEKAARLAILERDYMESRRDVDAGPDAPTTRAGIAERDRRIKAEHDTALAALLTPEEREQFELRTSNSAHNIGRVAAYFSGTEAEYRKIYDLQTAYMEQEDVLRAAPLESRGRAGIDASKKFETDLQAALGSERYAQWHRAQQEDYTTLVELQRRFALPQTTLDAVAAVPRQIADEGLRIAKDNTLTREQKTTAVRALADDARSRVRTLLGDDLGSAYNTASARGWLDDLERGRVSYVQPNGQRAVFLVSPVFSNQRIPAPTGKVETLTPKR